MAFNIQNINTTRGKGAGQPLDTSFAIEMSEHISLSVVELNERLMVAQTALLMSLDGTRRATATQISDRIEAEMGVDITPSRVGVIMSGFKVRSVVSSGRSRLVLDPEQLGNILGDMKAEAETVEPMVEKAIEAFGDIANRIESMRFRLARLKFLAQTEKELKALTERNRHRLSNLRYIEQRHIELQAQVRKVNQLEQSCTALGSQVEGLPSLEAEERRLRDLIVAHEGRAKEVPVREASLQRQELALAEGLKAIEYREARVSLAQLQQEISTSRQDFDDLKKQIGEKKSIAQKMFGR